MRNLFTLIFLLSSLLLSVSTLQGQQVQWATKVINFSSQYGTKDYSANQVLGVPNATGGNNLNDMAWVPKRENSPTGEFIHVAFNTPMRIRQVAVAESLNPGAIHKIYLYGPSGQKELIYENKNPRGIFTPFRIFRHKFPLTKYDVVSVRVELRTKSVPGSNQLDAIGISDSNTPIKATINQLEYRKEVALAEKLGPTINSEFAERLPLISPDGKTLYFARKYHPQNIGEENNDDIWIAYRQSNGQWGNAVNIGAPLNNKDHNFVAAFNPTGDILYLGSPYRQKNKDGVSVSQKRGRSWGTPRNLEIDNHYNRSEFVCYHLSLDQRVLLMSVEREDGVGGLDIYASFRQSDLQYSEPINLGSQINTVGGESSIFLAADGKTIYFSSNGHEGYGGYDMFMSRRLDDSWQNWTKPKNLGPKINSSKNEYNYSIPASGDYAYFSKGAPNGMSNIYRIPLPEEVQPEPVMLITGRLINAETNKPLNAQLKINQLRHTNDQAPTSISSDGQFQIVMPYGEDMEVFAETEGYYAISENLALSGKELEQLDYDQEGMMAQSDGEDTVISSGEIERLQLRLGQLDEDMKQLSVERERAKEQYQQQEQSTRQVLRNDPELEALRHKYYTTMYAKEETDKKQYGQHSAEDQPSSTGDQELDELRKKFNKHYKQENTSSTPTTSKTQTERQKQKSDELEEMRRKYQKHYDKDPIATKTETTPPAEVEPEVSTTDQPDFGQLEEAVRVALQQELFGKVYKELRRELTNKEIKDIESTLSPDEVIQLKEPGFVPGLRKTINTSPIPKISTQANPLLEQEQNKSIVKELKNTLEDDVLTQLYKSLTPQVKENIRTTLHLEIKKATEKRVREELEQKMQEQIKLEKAKYQEAREKPLVTNTIEEEAPLKMEYQEVEKDILLLPIKVGQIIPMNNLFFDSNQATLQEASTSELQRVFNFLKKNPKLIIEIGGHTNGWCSHVFANDLSWKRSQAVVDYLVDKGIAPSRLQHRGYGKTKPIATNDTKAGRKKNQRVEMKILEIID